jgi:TonB family protein
MIRRGVVVAAGALACLSAAADSEGQARRATAARPAAPLVADASEIPVIEHGAKAPGPWDVHLLPECDRCTWPEWPSTPDGSPLVFRMHVVLQQDGQVASARIVQVLQGDPAARPIGTEGRVTPRLLATPTARAGLAALAAVRQWRFKQPYDAPLLLTIDFGSNSPEPARERADGLTLRAGTDVPPPAKIVDVRPIYPPEAIAARITGVVIIQAEIGLTGEVESATVARSIPMLDEAALTAVRQWKYQPTVIKGEPVRVAMTVTVNFTLGEPSRPR